MTAKPGRKTVFAGVAMSCQEARTDRGDLVVTRAQLRKIALTGEVEIRCLGTISLEGEFRHRTVSDWAPVDLDLLRSGETRIRRPGKGLERTLNTYRSFKDPAVLDLARRVIHLPQQGNFGPGWEIRERRPAG